MIPWIQVYSNLPQHPKTSRLADELGLSSAAFNPNTLAVGLLVCLWTWAIQNACDGDLSGCSQRAIAEACQWRKKPDALIKALIKTGWLDEGMKLHDWEEYASLLIEQEENRKAKTRDRVKRYRNKKAQSDDTPCNVTSALPRNVTDTLSNAPTVPNLTVPDQKDYLVTLDNLSPSGGGEKTDGEFFSSCAHACESSDVSEFLKSRGLDPGMFFGMTGEKYRKFDALASRMFKTFTTRQPTKLDVANVFTATYLSQQDSVSGAWDMELSDRKKALLAYAFEAANNAGKPGDWKYINGVLARMSQRNITTLADAEDYDLERLPDGGM